MKSIHESLPLLRNNSYQQRYLSGWYAAFAHSIHAFSTFALAFSNYGREHDYIRRRGWLHGYAYESTKEALQGTSDYGFVVFGETGSKEDGTAFNVNGHLAEPYLPGDLETMAIRPPTENHAHLQNLYWQQVRNLTQAKVVEDEETGSYHYQQITSTNDCEYYDCVSSSTGVFHLHLRQDRRPLIYVDDQKTIPFSQELPEIFRPGAFIAAYVTPVTWAWGRLKYRTLLVESIHLLASAPSNPEDHGSMENLQVELCGLRLVGNE